MKDLNTSFQPGLSERDTMRLPYLPPGKCINHPTRVSVKKHLCLECFEKWEKIVLDFETQQTMVGEGYDSVTMKRYHREVKKDE